MFRGLGEAWYFHRLKVSSLINSLGKSCIFKVEKSDKHQAKQVTRVNITINEPIDTLGIFSCFFKNLVYLSIADLQCCVNFCYSGVIQLYIYILSFSYKLNKRDDNVQPFCSSFQILTQAVFPCLVLTVAS